MSMNFHNLAQLMLVRCHLIVTYAQLTVIVGALEAMAKQSRKSEETEVAEELFHKLKKYMDKVVASGTAKK